MNFTHLIGMGLSGLLNQQQGSFWMPPPGSTSAAGVDKLFYFIFWLSVFFFVLIVSLMVFFIVRYRHREGRGPEKSPTHHTALEITWSVIPLILVLFIFYFGFKGYVDLYTPPENAYEIQVVGQKWQWFFNYPNGVVNENLHVPVDTPVRLVITSEDVIHSLYIPAFRLKMDAVPGRYSKVWFNAKEPGEYDLFCAEYCGTGHSDMMAKVVVHDVGEFEKWMADAADIFKDRSLAEVGEYLYKSRGCAQCHTVDGSANVGPSFLNAYGREERFKDGSTYTVDENYVRESILNPGAKIVAGYQNVMPTYQGKLKEREITAIIEYLKSISEHYQQTAPASTSLASGETTGTTEQAPSPEPTQENPPADTQAGQE